MKKLIWAGLLLIIAGGIALFSIDYNVDATDEDRVGIVNFIRGEVKAGPENNLRMSYVNQVLPSGNIVSTGNNSNAVVDLLNGSYLSLNSNTQIKINGARIAAGGANNQMSIGVIRGSVRVMTSAEAGQQGFNIATPSSQAGVRGTEFLVGVADTGASNIMVMEGSVAVVGSGNNKEPVAVSTGQKSQIELNQNATTTNQAEQVRNVPAVGANGEEYVFSSSPDMGDWGRNEQQEARDNPIGTLASMTQRAENIRNETVELVQVVQNQNEQLGNAQESGNNQLTREQIQGIQRSDREINAVNSQNIAIAQLADNISRSNPDNNQVQRENQNVQRVSDEIDQLENQIDRFVADMEAKINAMVNAQIGEIDQMVGGWENQGFDNEGWEDGGFSDDDGFGWEGFND